MLVRVSDRAVLRYLERAYGLDVKVLRRHLAGRAANGARLGAVGVAIDNVKLVLRATAVDTVVVTVLPAGRPALDPAELADGE